MVLAMTAMTVYLIITEDVNHVWFSDPRAFKTEQDARDWSAKQPPSPDGYTRVLYRCHETETLE